MPVTPGNVNADLVTVLDGVRGSARNGFEGCFFGGVFATGFAIVVDGPRFAVTNDVVCGDTHLRTESC